MKNTVIIKKVTKQVSVWINFLPRPIQTYPNLSFTKQSEKDIRINGKRCEISTKLAVGDEVYMFLPDDFLQQKPKNYDFS